MIQYKFVIKFYLYLTSSVKLMGIQNDKFLNYKLIQK